MIGSFLLKVFSDKNHSVERLGHGNGAWNIASGSIDKHSTVVSAGVGRDISFELAIHAAYSCRVYMIDPSPTGAATIADQHRLPSGILFESIGIAARDETLAFAPPYHPDEGSFRLPTNKLREGLSRFRCEKLATLMQRHGLPRVDLLKLDVEGFEYEVLRDLVLNKIPVGQICVEFHHGIVPGISKLDTLKTILGLTSAGYRLINRDQLNFTFLSKQAHAIRMRGKDARATAV
jgi:FkbM family methyltransferase